MATAVESPILVADEGFTILSDPEDAVIDIVFVHGLQGHPQETWTYKLKSAQSLPKQAEKSRTSIGRIFSKRRYPKPGQLEKVDVGQTDGKEGTSQGKDTFWPRDLLKDDFPKARIMTFGYNTNITQGYHAAHQGNIFSHARDLLYELEAKRRKGADRDLVFMAHSLGGILVKEVLRRSEADPDAKINKIFTSTAGVFFFGTPHRGSKEWASFGEGVASVASRLLGVDKNNQVIHALLPNGPELELCRESFTVQWVKRGNSLVVRTFQESKGVTGVRWGGFNQLIVPPDSSTLDHPNQRARTIDEDHTGMVKFKGRNDRAYHMVREDIEELVENCRAAKETARTAAHVSEPRTTDGFTPISTEAVPSPTDVIHMRYRYGFPGFYWHGEPRVLPPSETMSKPISDQEIDDFKAKAERNRRAMENKLVSFVDQYRNELTANVRMFPNADQQREIFRLMVLTADGLPPRDPDSGRTLLHYLAMNGAAELVLPLISSGVSVDAKDSDGQTPLHVAVICNQAASVQALINDCNADVHAEDYQNRTPWNLALDIDNRNLGENEERTISKDLILRILAHHTDLAKVREGEPRRKLEEFKKKPTAVLKWNVRGATS